MKTILIIIALAGGQVGGIDVETIKFNSWEACRAAAEQISAVTAMRSYEIHCVLEGEGD